MGDWFSQCFRRRDVNKRVAELQKGVCRVKSILNGSNPREIMPPKRQIGQPYNTNQMYGTSSAGATASIHCEESNGEDRFEEYSQELKEKMSFLESEENHQTIAKIERSASIDELETAWQEFDEEFERHKGERKRGEWQREASIDELETAWQEFDEEFERHKGERKRGEWQREGLPIEISRMDDKAIGIFKKAVQEGKYNSYHIRAMFVGYSGAGKTTLTMALLGRKVDITVSTNGIDIFKEQCFYDRATGIWRNEVPGYKAFNVANILALAKYDEIKDGPTSESDKSRTINVLSNKTKFKVSWRKQKENPTATLLKRVVKQTGNKCFENASIVPVDLWDFGGQAVYFTTHQTFLSHRSIYILPLNLSLPLDHCLNDNNSDPSNQETRSIKAFLSYWINSITAFASGGQKKQPQIIIVLTHLDRVEKSKQKETVRTTLQFIKDNYEALIFSSQLVVDERLAMNATDVDDPAYDILRKTIVRVAENQQCWGEELPKSWLPVQEKIMEKKEKGEKICTLDEIKKMNETCMVRVRDEELLVILTFMHSLGILLFFSDPGLDDYILLDPQWLIDVFKSFITDKSFVKDRSEQFWENVERNGIIERKTLKLIWGRPGNTLMKKYENYLLKVLENLDLISTPKSYTGDGKISMLPYYYVPSMLAVEPPQELKCVPEIGTVFRFRFKKFLPLAVYNRLTAACLGTWTVRENSLFSGLSVFIVDVVHSFSIQKDETDIIVCVSHERGVLPNNSVCFGVQVYLRSTLQRIVRLYETGAARIHHGDDEKYEEFTLDAVQYDPVSEKEEEFCPSDCSGLSDKELNKSPTNQELCRLSRVLPADHFVEIGVNLEINEQDRHHCERLRRGQRDQYFELLHCWKKITPKRKCTVRHLLKALSETDGVYNSEHLLCKIHRMSSYIDDEELPTHVKNKVPSDRVLERTAITMVREYLQVAMELGFEYSKLTAIEENSKGDVVGVIRKMLLEWKKTSQYRPTAYILAQAMRINTCDYKYFCDLMKKETINRESTVSLW